MEEVRIGGRGGLAASVGVGVGERARAPSNVESVESGCSSGGLGRRTPAPAVLADGGVSLGAGAWVCGWATRPLRLGLGLALARRDGEPDGGLCRLCSRRGTAVDEASVLAASLLGTQLYVQRKQI